MAFNFNWSPLIADTSRARDMLTTALNKSPKPPIIVDDIIVTELNLGSIPPELEILEVGDLAEDKFRGIFKLTYTGDAFLTLKTRVQANPLNTYLSTKPTFASPQPLAAASSLTIPLQITLSDIRLSGFVILVFSKQKGITLVFRNDPLESLKVSSTFDSIPFVRDYLQKEIEGQLRILFMEDLPAIIHRLSLRLWSPDHQNQEENAVNDHIHDSTQSTEKPINPFASPPANPFDAFGRPLDEQDLASLSSDPRADGHATFSQKNLLRLATLTDSHRTLSLFTPPIQDAVFRAWAGAVERGDLTNSGHSTFTLSALSRHNSISSSTGGGSVYSYSDTSPTLPSRPSMSALSSAYGGSSGRSRTHNGRKRKTRVIDLRKGKAKQNTESIVEGESRPSTPTSTAPSSQNVPASIDPDGELETPPISPEKTKDRTPVPRKLQGPEIVSPRPQPPPTARKLQSVMFDTASSSDGASLPPAIAEAPAELHARPIRPRLTHMHELPRSNSAPAEKAQSPSTYTPSPLSGSILEQAWMMKMANEIAKRVQAEREGAMAGPAAPVVKGQAVGSSIEGSAYKSRDGGSLWGSEAIDETPPPAYAA